MYAVFLVDGYLKNHAAVFAACDVLHTHVRIERYVHCLVVLLYVVHEQRSL